MLMGDAAQANGKQHRNNTEIQARINDPDHKAKRLETY